MNEFSHKPGVSTRSLPRSQSTFLSRLRGFTLVELVAVLAIAAILAGGAAPSLTAFVKSIQLSSASNDLLWGLLMARSEAVKRGTRVAICKTADGAFCATDGGWEQGWIVFQDVNNDGERENTETVFHRAQPLPEGLKVKGNLSLARYLSYSHTGVTKLVSGGFQAGTFTLCRRSSQEVEAREIVVAAGGRPRVQKTRVSSCV